MKTKILFALALLAAVGMCEQQDASLVMQEAEGYEVDLPNRKYYKAIFEIPKEVVENVSGVDLKVGLDFVYSDIDRRITVEYNITNEANESLLNGRSKDFDDDCIDGKKLDLEGKCDNGCTVHLWFYADCGKTCVFDITTFFWARMVKAGDAYLFRNNELPYMPLYEGSWSPYFKNKGENSYLYFTFNSTDDIELPVDIESRKKSCSVVSGKNEITAPTKKNLSWIINTERDQGDFVEGPNYIGLYCSDPDDEYMRIRIGGALLLVPYFALAALAFFAF